MLHLLKQRVENRKANGSWLSKSNCFHNYPYISSSARGRGQPCISFFLSSLALLYVLIPNVMRHKVSYSKLFISLLNWNAFAPWPSFIGTHKTLKYLTGSAPPLQMTSVQRDLIFQYIFKNIFLTSTHSYMYFLSLESANLYEDVIYVSQRILRI